MPSVCFKIYRGPVHNSLKRMSAATTTKKTEKAGCSRDELVISSGVKGQMMVGGGLETAETERTRKMGTTWSATQVGLRGVKSGLGGHDAGVSGGDAGVKNTSIPITKRGRMAMSNHPTFSDFVVV